MHMHMYKRLIIKPVNMAKKSNLSGKCLAGKMMPMMETVFLIYNVKELLLQ